MIPYINPANAANGANRANEANAANGANPANSANGTEKQIYCFNKKKYPYVFYKNDKCLAALALK